MPAAESVPLIEAKAWFRVWGDAYRAIAVGGQAYKLGTRQLTRANIAEVRKEYHYWRNEVERLQRGERRGITLRRVVIRDL
ncbi:DUF6148 family protein [Yersinia mollaretii]|uniref:DUF6148 family protein n=1 Tax=Yersinia mollaretii TaxID=33060 RepID=UPI00119F265A|nr:DUF6148 family protein [Yersinia mollaretii]